MSTEVQRSQMKRTLTISRTVVPVPVPRLMGTQPRLAVRNSLSRGGHVALGQVHDVDVIADAGAVARRVVAAEDAELGALPQRHLLDVGHQVVGDAHRVLPDLACMAGLDLLAVVQIGVL